jgi:2'-5' RNA ligase
MQGIISMLDLDHTSRVHALWNALKDSCGMEEILRTPLPHITWHVAGGYQCDELEKDLEALTSRQAPIQIQANGIGLFTSPAPVLYIPVVRTRALSDLHQAIYEAAITRAENPLVYYSPDEWIPHITLAHTDADLERLQCALKVLGLERLTWQIHLEQLVLVEVKPGGPGTILTTYHFSARNM